MRKGEGRTEGRKRRKKEGKTVMHHRWVRVKSEKGIQDPSQRIFPGKERHANH
jgi:hypothetical protein